MPLDDEVDPMDEPFVTVDEIARSVEDGLDDEQRDMALDALMDATDLVRMHGQPGWTRANCPRIARTVVRAAALRFLNNPTGLTVTRAGDETMGWDGVGDKAGSVYLTRAEEGLIARAARGPGLTSVPIVNYAPMRPASAVGDVPVAGGGKPFPMFAGDGPW